MPWMMLLCALPLIILLLAGGNLSSRGYLWPVLIGGFVVAHFWIMLRGHRSDHNEHNNEAEGSKQKQSTMTDNAHGEHKKHGGCCH